MGSFLVGGAVTRGNSDHFGASLVRLNGERVPHYGHDKCLCKDLRELRNAIPDS
jgi:hypothetical protein